LADAIAKLDDGPFRVKQSTELTDRLYDMGIIKTKRLKKANSVNVKSFCRRRLPVLIVQSGMFDGSIETASMYVTHGHVRVGPHIVRDPAFLVTKNQEDFLTWTDSFQKKIQTYNNQVDDYED
jgi:U3 small nucleolar ribonucleoprotein protein IMP3